VTVFAPTNRAFEKLPRKLKLFLFSPFGERILQKLLRYHIVPDMAFFSGEWIFTSTKSILIRITSDYVHHREAKTECDFMDFEASGEDIKKTPRRWFFKSVIFFFLPESNPGLLFSASTGAIAQLLSLSRVINTV